MAIENNDQDQMSLKKVVMMTNVYRSFYANLKKEVLRLEEVQKGFPARLVSGLAFDDLVLQAANCKHEAIALIRDCLAVVGEAKADYEAGESYVLLYKSTVLLRDAGFDKLTDTLRSAATVSCKELTDLAKILSKLKSLEDSSTRLFRAFESDEVNFRKMYDKNDSKGF
jgi:hypothetical protein